MPILWIAIEMHDGTDTNSITVYSVKHAIRKSIEQLSRKKCPSSSKRLFGSSCQCRALCVALFALKQDRGGVINLFRGSHPTLLLSYGTNTRRKPT
ncbi:MAG: hypothetical protein WCI64_12520, partial [Chlorobium sp.]